MPSLRTLASVFAVALIVGACTADEPAGTTTSTTTPTTLAIAIRTTAESAFVVANGVDAGVAEGLVAQVDELRGVTESLRGLGFLGPPSIAVETPVDFEQRWTALYEGTLDAPQLAVDTRFLRTIGVLAPGEDIRALHLRNVAAPAAAFYDDTTGELVISSAEATLDGAARAEVVGQLVRMLTDQYHDHTARSAELRNAGDVDGADALAALALSDALYTQLRYIDTLSGEEQRAIAGAGVHVAEGPPVVVQELAFVGDAGLAFVGHVLEAGGPAALDSAYGEPLTTESILHPARFLAGEGVLSLEAPAVSLEGYTARHVGTFGELGLRGLLGSALSAGVLTQTADGWGADHEILLHDNEEVAFGYVYRGDDVDDTVEVAQAFLDHASFVMGMNEPQAAGGGVEFVGLAAAEVAEESAPAGPYVFVDRSGDVLVVVIATDPAAGRRLRTQLVG